MLNSGKLNHENNKKWIKESLSKSNTIVVSWGENGNWFNRNVDSITLLRKYCVGKIKSLAETRFGYPLHASAQGGIYLILP